MAEYVANALQTVEINQNVLFTDTAVYGNNAIIHRDGSGIFTLRGLTNQCRARFRVTFGANIAIPTGGTVEPISVAISIGGEPVASSNMIVTPAAAEDFWNISRTIHVDVPCGCCLQISVRNTSEQAIDVQNANLIIDRVA
jgi:hypothetical protein